MNNKTRSRKGGAKRESKRMTNKSRGLKLVSRSKTNITKNLRSIRNNMNKNIENPSEYLKKSQRFFKAIITKANGALENMNNEGYNDLVDTSGIISYNIYLVFKKNNKNIKNSINNLANLFGRIGLKKNDTYTHLLDEELAQNSPLEYLEYLSEEIDNMQTLYDKSISDGDENESTKVSHLMLELSEEIHNSIKEAIDHLIPKNETGLANLMNTIFKKAFAK